MLLQHYYHIDSHIIIKSERQKPKKLKKKTKIPIWNHNETEKANVNNEGIGGGRVHFECCIWKSKKKFFLIFFPGCCCLNCV